MKKLLHAHIDEFIRFLVFAKEFEGKIIYSSLFIKRKTWKQLLWNCDLWICCLYEKVDVINGETF